MKITLIGPVYPYRGGIAYHTASLAHALADAGHTVHLVSFSMQYPAFLYPGKSDRDPSEEPLRFPARYILNPLLPWTWLYAARDIRKSHPDIVIFQWWTTFWTPAYYCLARMLHRNLNVTFLIHNVLPHEPKAWDRWLNRMALRQGQAYIVQAPHERKRLLSLIPQSSLVFETHLPVFQPFSKKYVPKEEARQQLRLPVDKPLLLFFGIVRPYKGLHYLLEAMVKCKQPVRLVVAGEFWEDVLLYQKQIEQLGLADCVSLINRYVPNEEAHLLFSAADGLVAPYIGGTQSGAASLAIGYRLPVITTERVAAGMALDKNDQKSGYIGLPDDYTQIVPAEDSLALAQAIDHLILDLPAFASASPPPLEDWSGLVKIIEQIPQEKK